MSVLRAMPARPWRRAHHLVAACLAAACHQGTSAAPPEPTRTAGSAASHGRDTVTVTVRDPATERRLAQLEWLLQARDAQLAQMTERLEDARDEVVRTMSKLQTLASRAEAASAIAEADVALKSLRATPGAARVEETAQATTLLQSSSGEFNRQNYGGALYLAGQSKALVTSARARLATAERDDTRGGETTLPVPIRVKAVSRGNVREGPGTNFAVGFSVENGAALTAFAFLDDWLRVTDDAGRAGWIYRTLVGTP